MDCAPFVKETRRKFIREKRRQIRIARKALGELKGGCAINEAFDGTTGFFKAVYQMKAALDKMDEITKPLR